MAIGSGVSLTDINMDGQLSPSPVHMHQNSTRLLNFIQNQYDYVLFDNEDPRYMELPLIHHAYLIVAASFGYIFLVCWVLPKVMVGRQPFKMKKVIMIYNAVQVVLNIWIVSLSVRGGWFNGYSFRCQPVDYSRNPKAMLMVSSGWWFFIAKILDWLDTIFFMLRKSYGQVTFLHVTHHAGMPFCTWYGLKFIGGGQTSFVALCNSFVHVLMYFYYLLSGMGYQKYLWWKKYLTVVQMVQFVLLTLHQFQLFFVECDYPTYPRMWALLGGPAAFIFFYDFYVQAYKHNVTKVSFITRVTRLYGKSYACIKSEVNFHRNGESKSSSYKTEKDFPRLTSNIS